MNDAAIKTVNIILATCGREKVSPETIWRKFFCVSYTAASITMMQLTI
uniref:Uncharacterized protein n=1 Tax=Pseudomonas fluorescens (strain SBW25) TaxID=216595 RepID=A0A0G4E4Y1_PSEFS|nr:hypothetical protein PQBR57_0105 [Pseudomonas fluorescens SBW25]